MPPHNFELSRVISSCPGGEIVRLKGKKFLPRRHNLFWAIINPSEPRQRFRPPPERRTGPVAEIGRS